jgi:glycerol-3-phosphate dehydrogenase
VVQWTRSAGCPWDEETCSAAAANGHLEVLQWARANGCPWDVRTCHAAILADRPAVTEWLRANGCPWSKWAAKPANRAKLEWMVEREMQEKIEEACARRGAAS